MVYEDCQKIIIIGNVQFATVTRFLYHKIYNKCMVSNFVIQDQVRMLNP